MSSWPGLISKRIDAGHVDFALRSGDGVYQRFCFEPEHRPAGTMDAEGQMSRTVLHTPKLQRTWRRQVPQLVICLIAAIAALLSAQLVGSASAGATSRSAIQLLLTARSAAAGESSLHYVATTETTGVAVTISGEVAASEGEQTIVARVPGHVGHVTVALVAGVAYFKGDEPGLADFMRLPQAVAIKFANQWISLARTDAAYASVASGLTTASALSQIAISKPLSLDGTTKKQGQAVLAVKGFDSGTPPGASKRVTASVMLYLATHGRHLPVSYTASEMLDDKRQSQSVSFSSWGRPVKVTAPSGALPVSSLGSAPTEA
jgi:hypothetical protein